MEYKPLEYKSLVRMRREKENDESRMTDDELRPWMKIKDLDDKCEKGMVNLASTLAQTAPTSLAGGRGMSTIDKPPEEFQELANFVRDNPNWYHLLNQVKVETDSDEAEKGDTVLYQRHICHPPALCHLIS